MLVVWNCKRKVKRIEFYERRLIRFKEMVNNIKSWIRRDTRELNVMLKDLSKEDFDKFKRETGYITR